MPDSNSYHLYIHTQADDEQKSPIAGGKRKKSYEEMSAESLKKGLTELVSFSSIKRVTTTVLGHQASRIQLRTGAQEYEQKAQLTLQVAGNVVGDAAMIFSGIATGTAPLAIIHVAESLLMKMGDIMDRMEKIRLAREVENETIALVNRRIGANGSRQ